MPKWECSKCTYGHNSEVVMIHHQITIHAAVYSDDRLRQIGYLKYVHRLRTEQKMTTQIVKKGKHDFRRISKKK